jgi:probable regulatory domain-containing protein
MAQVRPQRSPADDRVTELFMKSVEALGGMRQLVDQRRLALLPELLESAYVLVMQEDEHRTPREIADQLSVSMETVENILAAPADTAMERAGGELPTELADRESVAGGVARHAYNHLHGEARPG